MNVDRTPTVRPGAPLRVVHGEPDRSGPVGGGWTVLVVDDDATVREVVGRYLRREGHVVTEASDGPTAVQEFRHRQPDLVVLDLMLPGFSGLDVCRQIRATPGPAGEVPVVMLTALGEESDRVVGLERGADDYVVKPFSPRELSLRVAGLLRRSARSEAARTTAPTGEVLTDGALVVDPGARTARRDGVDLGLTVREFDLLVFLLRHQGTVYTRADLLEKVWGWTFGDTSTVTVHVRRLREKVETDPANPVRIATVWGVGYRFDPTPVTIGSAG